MLTKNDLLAAIENINFSTERLDNSHCKKRIENYNRQDIKHINKIIKDNSNTDIERMHNSRYAQQKLKQKYMDKLN